MTWELIDTAPKDRDIIVFSKLTNEQFVAFWHYRREGWCLIDDTRCEICVMLTDITHWTNTLEPPPETVQ